MVRDSSTRLPYASVDSPDGAGRARRPGVVSPDTTSLERPLQSRRCRLDPVDRGQSEFRGTFCVPAVFSVTR